MYTQYMLLGSLQIIGEEQDRKNHSDIKSPINHYIHIYTNKQKIGGYRLCIPLFLSEEKNWGA